MTRCCRIETFTGIKHYCTIQLAWHAAAFTSPGCARSMVCLPSLLGADSCACCLLLFGAGGRSWKSHWVTPSPVQCPKGVPGLPGKLCLWTLCWG